MPIEHNRYRDPYKCRCGCYWADHVYEWCHRCETNGIYCLECCRLCVPCSCRQRRRKVWTGRSADPSSLKVVRSSGASSGKLASGRSAEASGAAPGSPTSGTSSSAPGSSPSNC